MVATIHKDLAKIVPLNMAIKIGNISTILLVYCEGTCSILIQSLLSRVVNSSSKAFWVRETA